MTSSAPSAKKHILSSKKMSGNNSVVECNLAKVDVASSNLVSRSIFFFQHLHPIEVLLYNIPKQFTFLLILTDESLRIDLSICPMQCDSVPSGVWTDNSQKRT